MDRTLLVVGSGASAEYDFPIGEELTSRLAKNFKVPNSKWHENLIRAGFHPEQISELARRLSMVQGITIDQFIRINQELNDICRYGIAQEILFSEWRLQTQTMRNDKYLKWILKVVSADSLGGFWDNDLLLVTFNYDRLIEKAFANQISGLFNLKISEANEKINSLNIAHVYGRLGCLSSSPSEPEIDFGFNPSGEGAPEIIRSASSQITTIGINANHLASTAIQRFNAYREISRIFFLGFGFNEENLNQLNLKALIKSPIDIFMTTFGMSDIRKSQVIKLLDSHLPLKRKVEFSDKCSDLLKAHF